MSNATEICPVKSLWDAFRCTKSGIFVKNPIGFHVELSDFIIIHQNNTGVVPPEFESKCYRELHTMKELEACIDVVYSVTGTLNIKTYGESYQTF